MKNLAIALSIYLLTASLALAQNNNSQDLFELYKQAILYDLEPRLLAPTKDLDTRAAILEDIKFYKLKASDEEIEQAWQNFLAKNKPDELQKKIENTYSSIDEFKAKFIQNLDLIKYYNKKILDTTPAQDDKKISQESIDNRALDFYQNTSQNFRPMIFFKLAFINKQEKNAISKLKTMTGLIDYQYELGSNKFKDKFAKEIEAIYFSYPQKTKSGIIIGSDYYYQITISRVDKNPPSLQEVRKQLI